ncbi:MAG: hypothetical protein QNJ68_06375 [Microcoleaceae cyanobacterium MO_207.B10]|nr:hypothetical protein [Microcoleaceae cyanobacterium MO_207.B10]
MLNQNLSSFLSHQNPKSNQQEQLLYKHIQKLARQQPEQSIQNFQTLFIDASGYSVPEIWQAMEAIIDSDPEETEFHHILNRSCYILINRWLQSPQLQKSIPDLVNLFEITPNRLPPSWTSKRLRSLVGSFSETEHYLALQRLAQMFVQEVQIETQIEDQKIENLINRYPYLYEHCFLQDESSEEEQREIKIMRKKIQQKYEVDLSKYIAYQRLPRKSSSIKNPTLISDQELDESIQYFTGKVDGKQTFRDQAQRFRLYCDLTSSYLTFKDGLYEYINDAIDPGYRKCQFNQKLYQQLQNTLPDNNGHKNNDSLIVGTCRKLLGFLVVESLEQPKHFVFYDLINNLGVKMVMGILLKIVLFCNQVKPYLEQRFSILFNHYHGSTSGKVWWLVKSLESLNVALTTNFGGMNHSCF